MNWFERNTKVIPLASVLAILVVSFGLTLMNSPFLQQSEEIQLSPDNTHSEKNQTQQEKEDNEKSKYIMALIIIGLLKIPVTASIVLIKIREKHESNEKQNTEE